MGGTPPTPKELARWLLSYKDESPATSEEITMAAVAIYEQLHAHFARLLGVEGFDALWTRALYHVQQASSRPDTSVVLPIPLSGHRLDTLVQGRDIPEVYDVLLNVFAQFLELLFTFIGADLGSRLLHQQWPALPTSTAPEAGEEMQP